MRKAILFVLPLLCGAALAQTAEEAQTQQLNQAQSNTGAAGTAAQQQYEQQRQLYQQQQAEYQQKKAEYDAMAERYLAARDRYAAERARYRRGEWPKRYEKLTFVDSDAVVGAPVETYRGVRVGRAEGLARTDGRIVAVRVALNDNGQHVWIDRGDLKYDTEDRLLVTNFAEHDLKSMAREQY